MQSNEMRNSNDKWLSSFDRAISSYNQRGGIVLFINKH